MRFENRKVWVLEAPKGSEKMDTLEYFYHVKPRLKTIIQRNKTEGLETLSPGFMDDLVNLMEKTFDQTVFNETQLTKAYGLGLDLSSFEGLRNQLEQDYGLTMHEEERIVKVVKVVYPN